MDGTMDKFLISKKVLADFRKQAKEPRNRGDNKCFNISINDLTSDVCKRLHEIAGITNNRPVTYGTPIQFCTRSGDCETVYATISNYIHSGSFSFWYKLTKV